MERTLEQILAHPVAQALNPEGKHFMEVRWLPPELNQFSVYGIEVAALIPFTVFPHIKTVPTWQMMLDDFKSGLYEDKHTIVVDSSGNTAHAVARLAPAFGFEDIKVVCASDVPESKKGILDALSTIELIVVPKGKSVSKRAKEEAQKSGHYHLNQYDHMGNVRGHYLHTAPRLLEALPDKTNLAAIAIAMGSGGTAAGVGSFIKRWNAATVVLGVRPKSGEQVPGARDEKRMAEVVKLPWEGSVDRVVEVSRKDSFIAMRQLWGAVEPQPGPTSGLACAGLMQYLASLEIEKLKSLEGKVGAFICPDDGRFYSDVVIAELDTDQGIV